MPVPEASSSYSRRYSREDTYRTYSQSTSSTGFGRSSYLSSYSKSSSTLPPRPPRPPFYDIRKYTGDTSTTVGSRFLSSSASRARDYGTSSSSAGSNYRSSVSPARGSYSLIRRQLESSAPSIAERIKAMELEEKDASGGSSPTASDSDKGGSNSRYGSNLNNEKAVMSRLSSQVSSSSTSNDKKPSRDVKTSKSLQSDVVDRMKDHTISSIGGGNSSSSSNARDSNGNPKSNVTLETLKRETPKREITPRREITPSPPPPPPLAPLLSTSNLDNSSAKEPLTNGHSHVNNINESEVMGPHSSKYIVSSTATISGQRDSPNRNENRDRSRSRYRPQLTTASDSSDNDSDAFSSSPQLGGGRFRSSGNGKDTGFEKAGLTGLRNIGNTCFMNTVLQCLSNTKPLLEYVMKDNYEADINRTTSGMKGALMRAYGELIRELWRDQRVVDTSAFKDQIQRFAPRFMGYSQQDAQEFLRYFLEGLHEDVNRVTAKPTPIHTDIDDSLSDNEKAAESWKRYLRYESSKIVDMFVGQFKSTLKCTICGHCSVTFDPFWDLSLPIPSRSSNVRLSQCFELLAKEEVLDGDEKPNCAKCQVRRKCTKSLAIQKFPKILVVHLKRFSLAERYRGKLSTLIDYPLNGLDLNSCSATRGQSCTYNLYGVANHSGSTYSGHYVASCKHPYTGEWHSYNDSRVSPISSHSVVSSEGYLLFYEQVGNSSLL